MTLRSKRLVIGILLVSMSWSCGRERVKPSPPPPPPAPSPTVVPPPQPELPYDPFPASKTVYVGERKGANIRKGAGREYEKIAIAEMGDSLTALGTKESWYLGKIETWYYIRLGDGEEGYVLESLVTDTRPKKMGPRDAGQQKDRPPIPPGPTGPM